MSNQPSITTAWACECGHVNSLDNRFCPNCGQHMPSEISQRVYEEEILLHNGTLIDKKKRNSIIAATTILVLIFLRTVMFAAAMLVGFVSLIFEWIYLWQLAKDKDDGKKSLIMKKSIDFTFVFSLIVLVGVRLFASGIESAVHNVIIILLSGWVISFIFAMISSLIAKKSNDITTRRNIFHITLPCVPKIAGLAIALWLI